MRLERNKALVTIMCIVLLVVLYACNKDDIYIKPVAKVSIKAETVVNDDPYTIFVNEPVTIKNLGEGQKVTLYTGKDGEEFGEGLGIALRKENPVYTTSYIEAGSYNIVIVATGFHSDGNEIDVAVDSMRVIVTDSSKIINSIKFINEEKPIYTFFLISNPQDFIFPYFTVARPNSDQNIVIPVHDFSDLSKFVLYKGTKEILNTTQYTFYPVIETNSKSVSFEVEGQDNFYNSGNDLIDHSDPGDNTKFIPKRYSVIAFDGSKNDYYACPMILPYFKSFSLSTGGNDYQAVAGLSYTDYKTFEYAVTLPQGVNLSSLTPTYVQNDPSISVTVENGEKTESDYSIDSTVTYKLEYTLPKDVDDDYKGEFKITSTLNVRVKN